MAGFSQCALNATKKEAGGGLTLGRPQELEEAGRTLLEPPEGAHPQPRAL